MVGFGEVGLGWFFGWGRCWDGAWNADGGSRVKHPLLGTIEIQPFSDIKKGYIIGNV